MGFGIFLVVCNLLTMHPKFSVSWVWLELYKQFKQNWMYLNMSFSENEGVKTNSWVLGKTAYTV